MLTRQGLMRIKTRALRRKVWFKVTSRLERGIIDLTLRCVKRIRSPVLAEILSKIITEISMAIGKSFLERVNRVGTAVAETISAIAEGWGNKNASCWKHDSSFIRLLGVNSVNNKVTAI